MLHLNGHIISQVWRLLMKSTDKLNCMFDTVEKVRISKRNMPSAVRNLPANVLQHYLVLDDTKLPVIDRHDRTVAAKMLTSSGGFGIANSLSSAILQDKLSVSFKDRKARAITDEELQSLQ